MKNYQHIDMFRSPYVLNTGKVTDPSSSLLPGPPAPPPRTYNAIEAFARLVKDFGLMKTQPDPYIPPPGDCGIHGHGSNPQGNNVNNVNNINNVNNVNKGNIPHGGYIYGHGNSTQGNDPNNINQNHLNSVGPNVTHGGYRLLQGDYELDNEVYGGPTMGTYSYNSGSGMRKETPERKGGSYKTDWVTFTEDTTFHGIKYIFQESPIKLRRVVWVVCVVAAILLFIVQVGERTSSYFQYNTNVDVSVIYTNSVPFPAVTICNQNTFRTTVAVEKSVYFFIDDVYSVENVSALNLSRYHLDGLTSEQFLRETAHQLEDLLDSCTWKGRPCNVSEHFVTTITELGVCYTFNSRHALTVHESGSTHALSVVLNVEQYQHMKGPQNDAGVKILLHNPEDFPLVKDLGFAVAPGVHTLVGVEMSEVYSKEAPYGNCIPSVTESMAQCKIRCRIRDIIDTCGCQDVFMLNFTRADAPVCGVEDMFVCAKAPREFDLAEARCPCEIPCEQTKYSPSLSYAQLSKFNMERLVLTDPQRHRRVKSTFLAAKETSQRVNRELAQMEHRQMTRLMELIAGLEQWLRKVQDSIGSGDEFAKVNDLVPILEKSGIFAADEPVIRDTRVGFASQVTLIFQLYERHLFQQNMSAAIHVLERLSDVISHDSDDLEDLLVKLTHCVSLNASVEVPTDLVEFAKENNLTNTDEGPVTPDEVYQHIGKVSDCDVLLALKYHQLLQLLGSTTAIHNALNKTKSLISKYLILVRDVIYFSTGVRLDNIMPHRECLKVAAKWDTQLLLPLKDTVEKINISEPYTPSQLLDILKMLKNDSKRYINFDTSNELEVFVKCSWLLQYVDRYTAGTCSERDLGCPNILDHAKKLDRAGKSLDQITQAFSSLKLPMTLMSDYMRGVLVPQMVTSLREYLNHSRTKLSLAQVVNTHVLQKNLHEFLIQGSEVIMSLRECITEIPVTIVNLKDAYSAIFNLTVPVMSDAVIERLPSIKYLKSRLHPSLKHIFTGMRMEREKSYLMLIEATFRPYVNITTTLKDDLEEKMDELEQQSKRLTAELQSYAGQCQMNDKFYMENFLQVDIFYKELSYEKIEQQPAFEFLSLLSEVGGFLGLLLGASVLTVCELLDFLAMFLIDRYQLRSGGPANV